MPRVSSFLITAVVGLTPLLLAAALISSLALAAVWLRERRRASDARVEAKRDALTGISNRLGFEERLGREWRRAHRYGRPLGLLLLDMDGLKGIIEGQGHRGGDRALRSVAYVITTDIRDSDMAARLAGDEFVVLCPETDTPSLERLAKKLRVQLDAAGVGMSIGIGEREPGDQGPEDMLARADTTMCADKARRAEDAPRDRRALATSTQPAPHAS